MNKKDNTDLAIRNLKEIIEKYPELSDQMHSVIALLLKYKYFPKTDEDRTPTPYEPSKPYEWQNQTCPKCSGKLSDMTNYLCTNSECPFRFTTTF